MVEFETLLDGDSPGFSIIDPKVTDTCEHIVDVGAQAGFESWGTFISRGILYNSEGTQYGAPADTVSCSEDQFVATTVSWSGDHEGTWHLLIPASGAKGAIAYFLAVAMGTEANPEETALDEESMDAYSELANTFAAQFAQALRGDEAVGGTINMSVTETKVVDATPESLADAFGADDLLCHTGTLTIEGIQPVTVKVLMEVSCTGLSAEIEERAQKAEEPEESVQGTPTYENEALARKLTVPILVVLARKKMRMEVIKELAPGSIVEFRKQSGEFLDVCAGNTKFGEGEVVIVNQHFGIQIRRFIPSIPATEELNRM